MVTLAIWLLYRMQIILCVTNDISTDQRVCRAAASLLKLNAVVRVIGRKCGRALPDVFFPFRVHRMALLFKKGPLFYAEFNLRLFLHLISSKADLIVANDLDTLLGAYLASRIKGKTMVYDCHELFTEVPELIGRKNVKRIWELVESWILPRLHFACTVSISLSAWYKDRYGISMTVIRNLPLRDIKADRQAPNLRSGSENIILYQGSLNVGRGLEKAILAMKYVPHARLVIIGSGDIETQLHELVRINRLADRVTFLGRLPQQDLAGYTLQADLGISLEEAMGLSYYYALPNKLFDYIQAGVPVLASDLPEMAAIVRRFGVGRVCRADHPVKLAIQFSSMLEDKEQRAVWKANLEKASRELCWEKEEEILLDLYRKAINSK